MRELLITRMNYFLTHGDEWDPESDSGRWRPIKRWILIEIMKTQHVNNMKEKCLRKALDQINLNNLALILFTASATDKQVVELYELICHRATAQR